MHNYRVLQKDVGVARKNWGEWHSVFEYEGPPQDNPLLTDSRLFRNFLGEYRVSRTIRKGTRDALRERLREPAFKLEAMLSDKSGKTLDAREFQATR